MFDSSDNHDFDVPLSSFGEEEREKVSFVVPAGEVRVLPPSTYVFESITIEEGATLRILPGSRSWLVLMCDGDFTLRGRLEYRRFVDSRVPVTAVAPDGTQLQHLFDTGMRGGAGGRGGDHRGTTGGAAGAPTRLHGGGGGGGAFYSVPGYHRGGAGDGSRGGHPLRRGGQGGESADTLHGGLVYTSVGGAFLGQGGVIDLRGEPGVAGGAGEDGWNGVGQYGAAGGGGGGGGPGGSGGVVRIRTDVTLMTQPTYEVGGGAAGAGGRAGAYNGQPGRAGTAGRSGNVFLCRPGDPCE